MAVRAPRAGLILQGVCSVPSLRTLERHARMSGRVASGPDAAPRGIGRKPFRLEHLVRDRDSSVGDIIAERTNTGAFRFAQYDRVVVPPSMPQKRTALVLGDKEPRHSK